MLFNIYGRALPHLSPMGAVSHRYAFAFTDLPFSDFAESGRGSTPQSHHSVDEKGRPMSRFRGLESKCFELHKPKLITDASFRSYL